MLDDVEGATFAGFTATTSAWRAGVRQGDQHQEARRREYVKDRPYRRTTVTGLVVPSRMQVREVTVDRPAPGTPPDSLYAHPTAPSQAHPYAYPVSDADFPKPLTVYPHLGAAIE